MSARPLKLVALVGHAGSGKDTAARFTGGWPISFAEPLKRFCKEVFGWSDATVFGPSHLRNEPDPRYQRPNGEPLTPRYALQTLGTEWGRQCDPDVWIKLALRRAAVLPGRVVITDCRFCNEARAVKAAGGEVWKIVRPGTAGLTGTAALHPSEVEIDSPEMDALVDVLVSNDGSLGNLQFAVRRLCRVRGFA